MTGHSPNSVLHQCTYCEQTGADCCVRQPTPPAPPVFAHEECAKRKNVRPLYRLLKQPPTRVVTFPWA